MGETTTLGEVIELAVTREIQAAEFYIRLASQALNPVMRSLFENLAEEELQHKARLELELMKEGLVAQTVGKLAEVDLPDYATEGDEQPDMDYRDALSLAIRKERRSFRLYVKLAGVIAEKHVHEVLLQLAEEEARHLVQFEMEYNRLTPRRE